MFYFVYVIKFSWFESVWLCFVQLVWFGLFCFVYILLTFNLLHIYFLLVAPSIYLAFVLVSCELQLMCHGWHGCGGTWFVLIWFRFSEVVPELVLYPVMSHFLFLNGHSLQFSCLTDILQLGTQEGRLTKTNYIWHEICFLCQSKIWFKKFSFQHAACPPPIFFWFVPPVTEPLWKTLACQGFP